MTGRWTEPFPAFAVACAIFALFDGSSPAEAAKVARLTRGEFDAHRSRSST